MGLPETAPYIRGAVAVPPCRARLQDSAQRAAQEPWASGRHVPCIVSSSMARSRALEKAHDVNVLRGWLRRVNGPNYPQPFLVEGPPGCFRLYVGEAAERIRTARGIQ
jgi:hypothetical protein